MKNRKMERIDKEMFRQLENPDQLGKVGGATILITYKATLIDGHTDLIPSDALQD